MRRLAVVASGWHYPKQFYEAVSQQKLPKNWQVDLFCISHRDPSYAKEEKKDRTFADDLRGELDKKLYKEIMEAKDFPAFNWQYIEKPNLIGDWGNSNQWLEDHNYKDYDLLLFTHDDNLILNRSWFYDIIKDKAFKEWQVLANSLGMPKGWIRGSCEFFKPSVLSKMGGRFDLSEVTLNREGETTASEDLMELNDWNNTINATMKFIQDNDIPVGYLSPSYRVSAYVIEGERGYISNTHGANTEVEDMGLRFLKDNGFI